MTASNLWAVAVLAWGDQDRQHLAALLGGQVDRQMPNDSPPYWLRPVHRWFFWWEIGVTSIYRVAAVVVAAIATTALLFAVGLHPLVGGPLALVVWIGLAVAQEHDERVTLPVDAKFH